VKRWTSINLAAEDERWRLLSDSIKRAGVDNEFVPWTGEVENFAAIEQLDGFEHVRFGGRIGHRVFKLLKVQSSWTTLLGVTDGMVRTEHGWWPLCALYESFGQILIALGGELDARGGVLIAGAGGAARTAIAAFFKAGFKNFLVTNFNPDEAAEMIADVRTRFFGLRIEWVPLEGIVLLPGETSVLVNCTPTVDGNPLLVELSYLNFLKRPGFLFDTSRGKDVSPLKQEAAEVGVRLTSGIEIAARSDVLWAKWAFHCDLDLPAYQAALTAALG
jgi:shikimate 5-dehydrogenase